MKIRSRWLTLVAARGIVSLMRLLFWTCRRDVAAEVELTNPYLETGEQRYLYSVWHDQIIMTLFTGRPQKMAGLVSRHQDGSYVADTMSLAGIQPVRGSTSRGGARALRELMHTASEYHIAITPDGPRGPRHEMKQGLIFLASRTGRAIVPVAYGCLKGWRIQGSWTDMLIPRPFTTVFARGGTPLAVPPELDREGMELWRRVLEQEMHRLEAEVDQLCGRTTSAAAPPTADVASSGERAAAQADKRRAA